MKLEGKVVLVTGGGRGIGRGIALVLAGEGADVAVADLDEAGALKVRAELEAMGRKAMAMPVDVTDSDQVRAMVDRTVETLGRIDISVHNAGVISSCPVEDMEEETWDHVMAVNAKGVFLCCRAVIPHMKRQGGGKIINIASVAGKIGHPGSAHYCASKFAVVGFTNALAKELAKENITVNAICPGIVRTYMWDYLAEEGRRPGESLEDAWERMVRTRVPQRRPQTAEDMGQLALYLAMADNITGQSINVDGGMVMN